MQDFEQTPLLRALEDKRREKATPFHMPGHKNGRAIFHKFANMVEDGLFSLDMTEIPGLDDLHHPKGPIKQAQHRAARLFGADSTFFLINGSTVGIHAAILAVCRAGEKILVPRDAHRSVIGACILAGVCPIWLPVALENRFQVPIPPAAGDIDRVIGENPGIKAVFYTYPTYYGLAGRMREITETVHRYGLPLIVDEAHGAHFHFCRNLPVPALATGADLVVQSTHKTLGAFTQASMLHIRGGLVHPEDVARQLRILQSTSPSYLLMSSLDAAVGHLETSGQTLVEKSVGLARDLRARLAEIQGVQCLGSEGLNSNGIEDFDWTKIYFSLADLGLSGYQAAERLAADFQIQVELADRNALLLMVSAGNTEEDCEKLILALQVMAGEQNSKTKMPVSSANLTDRGTPQPPVFMPAPEIALSPRDAWFATRKAVPLAEAEGLVAAEMFAPYPPGVPVLCPGEIISAEIVRFIEQFRQESEAVHGPVDPTLRLIEVVDG